MVELLVVVAIISILAAITFRVYSSLAIGAKTKATQATIKKIQGMIDQRVQAFNRYMQSKEKSATALDEIAVLMSRDATTDKTATVKLLSEGTRGAFLANSGGPQSLFALAANDPKRARLLARKELYRQMLPQRWEDTIAQGSSTRPASDPAESSECLYEALTSNPVYGIPPVASDAFSTNEVRDTDGDTRLEFVDAWGNPLRFYRWPTCLTHPTGANPPTTSTLLALVPAGGTPATSDTNRMNSPEEEDNARVLITNLPTDNSQYADPDDREGRLLSVWSNRATFVNNFHGFMAWHLPLIVSAGPNGDLGLYEPNFVDLKANDPVTNKPAPIYGTLAAVLRLPSNAPSGATARSHGPLTDNITNLNIRAGGN